jgi:hypothetical protein
VKGSLPHGPISSTPGHAKSRRKLGGPPPQGEVPGPTDSAEYREGTVKSTPARGVKETLKPCAAMPWEEALRF